jgi:arylsulfatase A
LPGDYRQEQIGLALYDLESDAGETTNVAAHHQDVVEKLTRLGDRARREIGGSQVDAAGGLGR